jgi:hypothetical protein
MQPPPFSMVRPLHAGVVVGFLRRLHAELRSLDVEPGIEVTVLLPGIYVYEAAIASLFHWENVRETASGAIYASTKVGSHTVHYSLSVLPEQAWRVARVTSNGAYLGHLHFMQTPKPETHAVGFIQDESIIALYDKSLEVGSPFHALLESRRHHDCQDRECWPACFGGWTAADNALITGDPLNAQPKLCLKGQ